MTSIEQLLEHSGWARRLAAGLVSDASRADDAVQDAWVAALADPPAHAENLGSWFAFLVKRAARRSARGDARRARRDREASRPEALPATDALERAELQRTLVDAVLALREPYKTAIVLAYFEELPPRKIARRLSLPASTVRSHIRRGLALLREDLEAKTDDRESLIPAIAALARGPQGSSAPPWTAGAASTGGMIVMTKTKIAVVALVLTAAGVLLLMRGPSVSTESKRTDEAASALALAGAPKGDAIQLPDSATARSGIVADGAATPVVPLAEAEVEDEWLRGRVVDREGAPVPDADVHALHCEARTYSYLPDMAYHAEEVRIAETRTDANGEFSLRLQPGRSFDLRVKSPAFAERQVADVRAGKTILVTLRPAAVFSGIVKRAPDGAPIAGALLVVESFDGYEPMWQGKTDLGGHYRAEGLDAGWANVLVIPEEQRSLYFEIELNEGDSVVHDFEVSDGGTVEGVVRDRTTEMPIAGAEVSAWSFLHQNARTDAVGRFVLHGVKQVPHGQIDVRAEGYGLREIRVMVKGGETVHADIELLPARVTRGRIVSREGTPVAAAYVAALAGAFDGEQKISRKDCRPARSAEDGSFELRNLRADLPHALFLRKEGFATTIFDFGDRETFAAPGATIVELGDVVLPRMSTLSGTIVDADGRGIAEAGITLHQLRANAAVPTDDFTVLPMTSEVDGRFRVLDLPAGKLRLTVNKSGFPAVEGLEVVLAEGEARRGLVIRLGGGSSLRGHVLDPDGGAAAGAQVHVSGGNLSRTGWPGAVASSDGSFVFSGLAPGEYTLHAEPMWDRHGEQPNDWMVSSRESVRAGANDVVLQLRHGVAIEGRIATPDGSVPARTWIVVLESTGARAHWTVSDEKGSFQLQAAAGTSVELRFWVAKPDPQSYWGFSADESTPPIAVVTGVRAGTKDLVVALPR